MYSEFAWKGFALFFHILDKLRLTRFHKWDPENRMFIKNPKPSHALYFFSNATIFVQFICIPVAIAVTNVVSANGFPLRATDAALLCLLFMAGMHSFPIYYKQLTAREELVKPFNEFIKLENFLRKNQMFPIGPGSSKKPRLDIPGIVLNIMSPMFFAFPFASPVIVYLNLDPLYFIGNREQLATLWGILVRIFFCFVAISELALTLGTTHYTFITITLHCHWTLTSLKSYLKPRGIRQNNAMSDKYGFNASNSRRHKMINAARILRSKDPGGSTTDFERFDDIQLYLFISYLFRVIRLYIDTSAAFTIGPGFWIDVVCNYAAIKLYEEMDIFLYAYFCLIAVLAPCIIVGELPQAGKSYDNSLSLLKHWKCTKRKTYRRKYVTGLNTVGFSIGSFFIIKGGTFGTFMEELLNYTISSILTL